MSKISIGESKTYEYDIIEKEIFNMLDALEKDSLFNSDTTVLLKPNLLADKDPYFAVTTNPTVVKAVAAWLKSKGVINIILADSPGGSLTLMPGFSFELLYEKTGFSSLKDEVVLNTDGSWSAVKAPSECKIKSFNILNVIQSADVIINIAKLKTHGLTTVSFGIKNLFGCIPDMQKPALHARYPKIDDFANMLVELALTVKPAITVIDAVDIMEGNGPVYGNRRNLGLLFASDDIFSQDCYIAEKLGVSPERVEMLANCLKRNLVTVPETVYGSEMIFEGIAPLTLPDSKLVSGFSSKLALKIRELISKIYKDITVQYPVIDEEKCVACGICSSSCPRSAISIEKYASVDYSKCISCLCCNELCPNGAVTYKAKLKSKFGKDLRK